MKLVIVSFLLIFLVGCSQSKNPSHKVTGVERLFMHTTNHYSALVRQGDSLGQLSVYIQNRDDRAVRFVDDVPAGQPMWLEFNADVTMPEQYQHFSVVVDGVTFHVSSVSDLNGAGWNRGKQGRGQVTVIQ